MEFERGPRPCFPNTKTPCSGSVCVLGQRSTYHLWTLLVFATRSQEVSTWLQPAVQAQSHAISTETRSSNSSRPVSWKLGSIAIFYDALRESSLNVKNIDWDSGWPTFVFGVLSTVVALLLGIRSKRRHNSAPGSKELRKGCFPQPCPAFCPPSAKAAESTVLCRSAQAGAWRVLV